MNRAPSSLDFWWADHQRTCGGTYTKIKEPEGYGKKGKKDGKKNGKTTDKETPGTEKPSSSSAGKVLEMWDCDSLMVCDSNINLFYSQD